MRSEVEDHLQRLVNEGEELIQRIPREVFGGQRRLEFWVPDEMFSDAVAWARSAATILANVAVPGTSMMRQVEAMLSDIRSAPGATHPGGVASAGLQRMLGLVKSALADWRAGMLRKIEFVFVAATFDNFLEQAEGYHKAGKFKEAAVLASAVLEDTVRKMCERHSVDWENLSVGARIDGLVKAMVVNQSEATRMRTWAGPRNRADHAEWEKLDAREVGLMIAGVRDLIAHYL